MISAMELSKHIRDRKKAMKDKLPEVVENTGPDVTPIDAWNAEKDGYVEEMTNSPAKMSSEDEELSNESPLAIHSANKARAMRLRKMMNEKGL